MKILLFLFFIGNRYYGRKVELIGLKEIFYIYVCNSLLYFNNLVMNWIMLCDFYKGWFLFVCKCLFKMIYEDVVRC